MDSLDKEEKEIIEFYERYKWISTDESLKETISNAAKNQKKRIDGNNK